MYNISGVPKSDSYIYRERERERERDYPILPLVQTLWDRNIPKLLKHSKFKTFYIWIFFFPGHLLFTCLPPKWTPFSLFLWL